MSADANPRERAACAAIASLLLSLSHSAAAGEFSISPIRVDLGGIARSGAIVVRNDDTKQLSFQIRAAEWSQDASGADVYSERTDLVFFPKLLAIRPGDEAVIRVGVRQPLVQREQAFRLFVEEMPAPDGEDARGGSHVRVLMRFGVPIFVSPAKAVDQLDTGELQLAKGVAQVAVTNSGNQHQAIEDIQFAGAGKDGSQVFAMRVPDRYLLAGTHKSYTVTVPAPQCAALASLTFVMKTNRTQVSRRMDVNGSMCR